MASVSVRDFRPDDTDDLYEVCLRTGASGGDATGQVTLPRLLGDIFVGPYLALSPELALVADDGFRAAGYALAVLDTAVFEARLDQQWWPALQARYVAAGDGESGSITDELLALVANPDLARHPDLPGFPSHLHIDLLAHVRGDGVGTRMLAEVFARLTAAGSPGVHLGVDIGNVAAQRFYRRLGFVDVVRRRDELFMGLSWEHPVL